MGCPAQICLSWHPCQLNPFTRLADAAYRQMRELPFYHNFNHRAVAPATDLAERLVALAPVPMSKVFFTNSGSEANDTALKMIWYRANAMGQGAKKKVIARRRGFHGVTIGAASLTGLPMNHGAFDLPIPQIRHVTCPHHWREALPGESEEAFASRLAEELDRLASALAARPELTARLPAALLGASGESPVLAEAAGVTVEVLDFAARQALKPALERQAQAMLQEWKIQRQSWESAGVPSSIISRQLIQENENQNRHMIADLRSWQRESISDLVRMSYLPPLLMIFITLMLVGGLATMLTMIIWLKAWATLGWISLALIIVAIIVWVIFLIMTNQKEDD